MWPMELRYPAGIDILQILEVRRSVEESLY